MLYTFIVSNDLWFRVTSLQGGEIVVEGWRGGPLPREGLGMPGMQFEYDRQGGTFYYFLLSFVALILLPRNLLPVAKEIHQG